jgi:glycosyltransferase involved in cell wall biosynthesis
VENKPLVSIIMPAYNAEKTIVDSIESVLRQTYINWELIVVNDGSKDSTSEVVLAINDERLRLIEQENGGVANARNNGINYAKGEYIAFLDSDDLWVEEKLEIQITTLEVGKYKMCFAKTWCFGENLNQTTDCFVNVALDFEDRDKILIYDFIPILTVLIAKDVLEDVGYFDETLHGVEDWDLWIRVLQKYDAIYVDEFLAKYRISSTGLSGNFEKHFIEEEKVWMKHIDLYSKEISSYRQWFANKKQTIIAKQNKNIFDFLKNLLKLLRLPNLLFEFLYLKYLK